MSSLADRHILLVAEYYPSGGTRTYLFQLLDFYARHGAKVTLVGATGATDEELSSFAKQHKVEYVGYGDVLASQGEHEPRGGTPTVWSWREWQRERRAFRRFARDIAADRVVVSAGTPGMLLGAVAATPRGIYILHTYPHGRRQEVLARPYLSRFIPRGTAFVAVSDFEKRIVSRLWRLARRGCTIRTIVNTAGVALTNFSEPSPPWTVITLAMVEEYKRPFDWIDAAELVLARVPHIDVDFVWWGDGSLAEEARAYARAQPHHARIRFPGILDDVASAYETCRLYLQMSSTENMSLAVIDAGRFGVPSIVTNVGGLPEIVRDGVNGLVIPPRTPTAAADAIIRVLEDPKLWAVLASGAANEYSIRHSPDAWEAAMLKAHDTTQRGSE